MEYKVLYLDEDDDIISVRDRLAWTDASRIVFVIPEDGAVLRERLDLALLARNGVQLGKEVGLVCRDGEQRKIAREVGLAVFASLAAVDRARARREWWRARERQRPGIDRELPSPRMDEGDRREIYRRLSPLPTWRSWLLRYVGILIFFVTLALLFVGVAYAVPGATITLEPLVQPVRISREIVADPRLEQVSYSGASVPARQIAVTVSWQATAETTGVIDIPDAPARGRVIFANLLAQPVSVPAGTRVSTSAGETIVFQTLHPADIPGVVGGTAEVDVVAVRPGLQGNVGGNLINRIEGPLALQLEVRNLEPMEGGGVRQSQAVTAEDRERLRAQVLQFLQARAVSEMSALLTANEFLAEDSLRLGSIFDETYSHFVGEQTSRLTLEMRVELIGTAVDATQANGLIYQELVAAVPEGFQVSPASIRFHQGEVSNVDDRGRVHFTMIGEGLVAAELPLQAPVDAVAGQEIEIASAYLYENLPLRAYPTIQVRPNWFNRVPYLPARIQTEIKTDE